MKVHVIKEKTIRQFIAGHSKSKIFFEDWLFKVKMADWNSPKDIRCTFPQTDFLGNGSFRVVFDIGGNNYRMICKYAFGEHEVHLFVCWIGSHSAYEKLCKAQHQYTVNIY